MPPIDAQNALKLLVMLYAVQPDQRVLDGLTEDAALLASYMRFFDRHVERTLPESRPFSWGGVGETPMLVMFPTLRLGAPGATLPLSPPRVAGRRSAAQARRRLRAGAAEKFPS